MKKFNVIIIIFSIIFSLIINFNNINTIDDNNIPEKIISSKDSYNINQKGYVYPILYDNGFEDHNTGDINQALGWSGENTDIADNFSLSGSKSAYLNGNLSHPAISLFTFATLFYNISSNHSYLQVKFSINLESNDTNGGFFINLGYDPYDGSGSFFPAISIMIDYHTVAYIHYSPFFHVEPIADFFGNQTWNNFTIELDKNSNSSFIDVNNNATLKTRDFNYYGTDFMNHFHIISLFNWSYCDNPIIITRSFMEEEEDNDDDNDDEKEKEKEVETVVSEFFIQYLIIIIIIISVTAGLFIIYGIITKRINI